MIGPDRRVVRRLRQCVRAEVKASPVLRRERKRTRGGWRHWHYSWNALRFVIPVIVAGAVLSDAPIDRVAAMLAVWSAVVVFHRAAQFRAVLHAPHALWIFYLHPLKNAAVFQQQWGVILRASLWLGIDWLVFAIVVTAKSPSLILGCAVPLFAFAQWAAALALASSLVRFWPRLPYAGFAAVLYVLSFVLFQTFGKPDLAAYTLPLLRAFEIATPAGWLAQAFASTAQGHAVALLVPLGIGAAAAGLLRWHWLAFRNEFSLERIFGYDNSKPDPADSPRWISADAAPDSVAPPNYEQLPPDEPVAPVDLPALKSALTREIEQPDGLALFRRGALERFITRLLTPRQRVLADFLQPHRLDWSRGWLVAFALIVLAAVLQAFGFSGTLAVTITLWGVGLFGLPILGSGWLGFSATDSFQARIGFCSFFPVGFWECVRMLLTIAFWRSLAGLPLLVLAVRFGAAAAPLPWDLSLGWALRGWIAVLALQPIWAIAVFSKNSNDSSARGWLTALLAIAILLGLMVVVTAGVVLFGADEIRSMALAGAVLLSSTYGALLFYGWSYNRGLFDLIAKPRVG